MTGNISTGNICSGIKSPYQEMDVDETISYDR